jgi:hypothetical protein
MLWSISWLTPRLGSWLESRRRWARFREAVREYAYACAEEEFERAGYVRISGGDSWAYEYMPAFLDCLDDELRALRRIFLSRRPKRNRRLLRSAPPGRHA